MRDRRRKLRASRATAAVVVVPHVDQQLLTLLNNTLQEYTQHEDTGEVLKAVGVWTATMGRMIAEAAGQQVTDEDLLDLCRWGAQALSDPPRRRDGSMLEPRAVMLVLGGILTQMGGRFVGEYGLAMTPEAEAAARAAGEIDGEGHSDG